MPKVRRYLFTLVAGLSLALGSAGATRKAKRSRNHSPGEGPILMWHEPRDIATRDLFNGPGGKAHAPKAPFTFEAEDMNGSNPKFIVVDQEGVKWTVKIGEEARPETAASRIVWSVGYFTNEDYLLPVMRVEGMPKLRRGGNLVSHDGTVHDARLKRHSKEEKNIGSWAWADNPFVSTREWYGLRVLMAAINNWDLKDSNNSVYQILGNSPEQHYVVTDLGSSFGSPGLNWERKGSLKAYQNSKMISHVSTEFIDFRAPARPKSDTFVDVPELTRRLSLRWIGQHIPVADARWMGHLLAQLSHGQIRDAFRAANYSPQEIEAFAGVLEERIAQLDKL